MLLSELIPSWLNKRFVNMRGNSLKIDAKIENLKYESNLCQQLKNFGIDDLLSGVTFSKAAFLLSYKNNTFAISHWVSPKRTRSYPYARVYDTMNTRTRITIIPFLKDEGKDGDRDFIQWDTVSLMSLLGVYVILGYYKNAKKNSTYSHKITDQEFDYDYLKDRLDELSQYKLDALHWNLNELNKNLLNVAELSKLHYQNISKNTGVVLHGEKGVSDRVKVIRESVAKFQSNSRDLAVSAQNREYQTTQPKESVIEDKATITIKNYLGGFYYFTIDEVLLYGKELFLMEKKHSSGAPIPSIADIKDGLVKMMLYTNFSEVLVSGKPYSHHSTLGLTSENIQGYCHNLSTDPELNSFFSNNAFSKKAIIAFMDLITEATKNNFLVFLMDSRTPELQKEIVVEYLKRKK
ncbi:MAG: hypothetical protein KKI06_11350 [Euryarchaeota archaeon]|nr:hypothetical protein [Euryarchaeota archaeon]MBU4220930.1 hypothetical protein [Euryarchaeota archaeon]MBU4454444.1 hypothetical protein [Euryarchaeota archaeon]MDP3106150.1 hypothetical protein [Candidatus Methanoperedens sp.]